MSKVINRVELYQYSQSWKKHNQKIVLCHGCFDPVHAGHIDYFKQAKALGDKLVVSVTNDTFLNLQKGDGRPFQKIDKRLEILSEINCIDYLIENNQDTVEDIISILQPDIYAKGAMNQLSNPKLDKEKAILAKHGGKIAFLKLTPGISASKIISNEAFQFREYMAKLSQRYSASDIITYLDKIQKLKVLVIGETIFDKYSYVTTLDKAPKTSILATKYHSEEVMVGASAFIANIIANFVDKVTFVTYLGKEYTKKDLKESMADNIDVIVCQLDDRSSIIKHRFMERDFIELSHRNTLFEVCYLDDDELPQKQINYLKSVLDTELLKHDLVVASDFGHGLINNVIADTLSLHSPFLSVMVQANESNYGYNLLSKYKRYQYLCTNGIELRLNYQDKYSEITELIKKEMQRTGCNKMAITGGGQGAYIIDSTIDTIPILPVANVVDRIGAGDAFLALSSLFAKVGCDKEIFGLAGIVSSSMKIETLCTKEPIQKQQFINKISEIFAHV